MGYYWITAASQAALGVCCAFLVAMPAGAQTLDPGQGAEVRAEVTEAGGTAWMPTGPWKETDAPGVEAGGTVDQIAWRFQTTETTWQVQERLSAQLTSQGWAILYSCEAEVCGGFDFRFALPLLSEPDMHVDLGDYRYVAAQKGGAMLSLTISRAQSAGFVQMTTVTPGDAVPPVAGPSAPVEGKPEIPAQTGGFAAALRDEGTVVLEDLNFDTGARDLAPGDYPSLRALADYMTANPAAKIALVGHTDATGALAGNIAISKARAASVGKALVALGVPAARVEAEGVGYLAPRTGNQTAAGQAQNRRVEAVLTSTP